MNRERNLDSIRDFDKQITEHEVALARLKRTRNSLLNISTLIPPEILGNIFYWTTIPEQKYSASPKPSYNFLFVSRNWFEVASHTPQLWTSWGNNLRDWERRYTCPRVPRLHLELTESCSAETQPLSGQLRDALQDRAARDFIRRVELTTGSSNLLNSIVTSITTSGEGIQSSSLESFELRPEYRSGSTVELSNFFARYHFPKLRHLRLSGRCSILSWDPLASRIPALTILSLGVQHGCPTPSTSQLHSILSSNPNLQCLELFGGVLPKSNCGEPSFQVQLRHLKDLYLSGDSRSVLGLLDQLVPVDKMDRLKLELYGYSTLDISQTLGQYLGAHLRRRGKQGRGLAIGGKCNGQVFHLTAGDVDEFKFSGRAHWFMEVTGVQPGKGAPQGEECEKAFFDTLAHVPQDHVVYYQSPHSLLRSTHLSIGMFNLIELRATGGYLSEWFGEQDSRGTNAYGELLPSLKYLLLSEPALHGGDWSPLITFLSRRASAGNRLDTLTIPCCPHMCPDVVEDIRREVGRFDFSWSRKSVCPRDKERRGGSRCLNTPLDPFARIRIVDA